MRKLKKLGFHGEKVLTLFHLDCFWHKYRPIDSKQLVVSNEIRTCRKKIKNLQRIGKISEGMFLHQISPNALIKIEGEILIG